MRIVRGPPSFGEGGGDADGVACASETVTAFVRPYGVFAGDLNLKHIVVLRIIATYESDTFVGHFAIEIDIGGMKRLPRFILETDQGIATINIGMSEKFYRPSIEGNTESIAFLV